MSAKKIAPGVATIEAEAEKILKDARARAGEIRRKGTEEAAGIMAAEVPLDKAKAESEQIVKQARGEADKVVAGAKKNAAKVRTSSRKKTGAIIKRIVGIVTGGG